MDKSRRASQPCRPLLQGPPPCSIRAQGVCRLVLGYRGIYHDLAFSDSASFRRRAQVTLGQRLTSGPVRSSQT